MSVTLERRVIEPGTDHHVEAAWELKERIRDREGVLKQRRGFFNRAYRRGRCQVLFTPQDELVGFSTTRSDGYMLFLAVDPSHRGEGHGRRLVSAVADKHESVTCHARTSNDMAVGFYQHLGFQIERRISNYYEDGGDAYLLRLGNPRRLSDRLKDYLPSRQ